MSRASKRRFDERQKMLFGQKSDDALTHQSTELQRHSWTERREITDPSGKKITRAEYIKTDWWQHIRSAVIWRDGGKCADCGAVSMSNHVHHEGRSVRMVAFNEDMADLVQLCPPCHAARHGLGPDWKPTKARKRA